MKRPDGLVNANVVKSRTIMITEFEFPCPVCGQMNILPVDASGGRRQTFTTDCEVCCRPIRITQFLDDDGTPVIDAEAESME